MGNCFEKRKSILDIDIPSLNYIAFKGGGGKGITYLGPLEVLEEQNLLPLKLPISPIDQHAGHNQGIIGISGTSAGAITAYLVSLGLTTKQIRNESGFRSPELNLDYDPTDSSSNEFMPGENITGFNFEKFLTEDLPEAGYRRAVVYDKASGRNKLVRAVDALTSKKKSKDVKRKEIVENTFQKAINDGLNPTLAKKVASMHTRKEISSERKVKIFPAHYTGEKGSPDLEKSVKRLKDYRKETTNKINVIAGIIINDRKFRKSKSAIFRTIFASRKIRNDFFYNILYDQGAFPGFRIQEYYMDVTSRRLPVSLGWNEAQTKAFTPEVAGEMTFAEFFEYTGFDLIVGGLNVTNGNQRNFSAECTPDFPVVAAVMMSMNIPGLFKPIYVDAVINKKSGESARLRQEFQGYYIDAGLANNIPFHAFDDKIPLDFLSKDRVNMLLVGLAVQEGPDPEKFEEYFIRKNKPDPYFQTYEEENGEKLYEKYVHALMRHEDDPDFPTENFLHILAELKVTHPDLEKRDTYRFKGVPPIKGGVFGTTLPPILGWMLNTVLVNTTVSQTREPGATDRLIEVYSYHIGITDFKADENLTEFVVRRAYEKTKKALGLDDDDK